MLFLLIPLLTRYLTVEEFGYLGIATIVVALLTIIEGLSPNLFVIRNFCRLKKEDISDYLYHGFLLILFMLVLTSFTLWLLSDFLSKYCGLGLDMLLVLAVLSSMMASVALVLAVIQMEKKALLFTKLSFVSSVLQIIFVALFVVVLKVGWKGKIFADLIASIIFVLLLMFYLKKRSYLHAVFSWFKMKNLLGFSLILLPHSISVWSMNHIGRFFLMQMVNVEVVGLYSAAYIICMGIMLLYDSMQRAWQPYFFEEHMAAVLTRKRKVKIIKYIWLYYLGCIALFFIYTWVVLMVMPYMMGEGFQEALQFVPLIVMGFTFHGMSRVCSSYLYHLNCTGLLSAVSVTSVVLNVVLNYMLISRSGAIGAAQASALTYLFSFVVLKIIVLRYSDMPWFAFCLQTEKR